MLGCSWRAITITEQHRQPWTIPKSLAFQLSEMDVLYPLHPFATKGHAFSTRRFLKIELREEVKPLVSHDTWPLVLTLDNSLGTQGPSAQEQDTWTAPRDGCEVFVTSLQAGFMGYIWHMDDMISDIYIYIWAHPQFSMVHLPLNVTYLHGPMGYKPPTWLPGPAHASVFGKHGDIGQNLVTTVSYQTPVVKADIWYSCQLIYDFIIFYMIYTYLHTVSIKLLSMLVTIPSSAWKTCQHISPSNGLLRSARRVPRKKKSKSRKRRRKSRPDISGHLGFN